jgi:hypothetical protein
MVKMIHFPLYIYQTKLYSPRGILAGMDRLRVVLARRAGLDKPSAGLTLKG